MIQKNWQDLIKPTKLDVTPGDDGRRSATLVPEPLERGFGVTLGNALRRVLLSSLQGAAVTSVHIDGVLHEFSSIPGVREDVTDVVLNIKALALRMHADGPKRMRLRAEGPGEVTAGQIETGPDIEIMNPDLVICTLDREARRRLRGRHPLCGIGVTSRIDVTVKPAACSARCAEALPEPGPDTSTSRVRMPCSDALRAACSAATCAA